MKLAKKILSLLALLAAALVVIRIHYVQHSDSDWQSFSSSRRLLRTTELEWSDKPGVVRPYSCHEISQTARECREHPLRVLIFDGQEFSVFNLENDLTLPSQRPCRRCLLIIPMLVDALRSIDPERFQPGKPPFQLVFSTSDSSDTECVNHPAKCDTANFAPWMEFGSVLKDSTVLPTVRAFPNWFYIACMYEWRTEQRPTCFWQDQLAVRNDVSWSSLKPQVVWRGSDFHFLGQLDQFKGVHNRRAFLHEPFQSVGEELTKNQVADVLLGEWDKMLPRWRGVALTIKAEAEYEENGIEPWIDVKFLQQGTQHPLLNYEELTKRGIQVTTNQYMDSDAMAKYKYQIDFGGGGGTSWKGTMSKLAMPGLLFHHETPTKDWFYDELQPWVHYVPIQWDVSDLRQKYEWAEAHPTEAEKIAKAGTQFALRLMSSNYMKGLYEQLFIQDIGHMVVAYRPATEHETLATILKQYEEDGFIIYRVSGCDGDSCVTHAGDNEAARQEKIPTQ